MQPSSTLSDKCFLVYQPLYVFGTSGKIFWQGSEGTVHDYSHSRLSFLRHQWSSRNGCAVNEVVESTSLHDYHDLMERLRSAWPASVSQFHLPCLLMWVPSTLAESSAWAPYSHIACVALHVWGPRVFFSSLTNMNWMSCWRDTLPSCAQQNSIIPVLWACEVGKGLVARLKASKEIQNETSQRTEYWIFVSKTLTILRPAEEIDLARDWPCPTHVRKLAQGLERILSN